MPIEGDRLFYSFIWDRYAEQDFDEIGMAHAGIIIDPTNKNIDMKAQIRKLVKLEKKMVQNAYIPSQNASQNVSQIVESGID